MTSTFPVQNIDASMYSQVSPQSVSSTASYHSISLNQQYSQQAEQLSQSELLSKPRQLPPGSSNIEDENEMGLLELLQSSQTTGMDSNEVFLSILSQQYPDINLDSVVSNAFADTVHEVAKPLFNAMNLRQIEFNSNNVITPPFEYVDTLLNEPHKSIFEDHDSEEHDPDDDDNHDNSYRKSKHEGKGNKKIDEDSDGPDNVKLKRREQIKKASKLYRLRKKESEKFLETQLAQLRQERQKLAMEKEAALKQVQELTYKVYQHRDGGIQQAAMIEKKRIALLKTLKSMLENENWKEEEVINVLSELRSTTRVISGIATSHAQHLISVQTSLDLAKGFVTGCTRIYENEYSIYGIGMFVQNLTKALTSLRPEQLAMIHQIVAEYYLKLKVLHEERKQISVDLSSSFGNDNVLNVGSASFDYISPHTFEKLTVLDTLRRNLHSEANLFEHTFDAILCELTTKQQARVMLSVEYQHTSVMMLKGIYQNMNYLVNTGLH